MSRDYAFPFISTWSECLNKHWLNHSQILFRHPALSQEAKALWRWLATTQQSANKLTISCSNSIEQLSIAMNISCEDIHRHLLKLKLMGFLRGPLPILVEKLTFEMTVEVRKLVLCMPSKIFSNHEKALAQINEGVNWRMTEISSY